MHRTETDDLKRRLRQHSDPRSGDDDHSVALEALECIEDLEQKYADMKRRIDEVRELPRFQADRGMTPDKEGEWINRSYVLETLWQGEEATDAKD